MWEIVGGSFTAVTSTLKLVSVVSLPSLTLTVMIALPDRLATGVSVTVRFTPAPPNTMLSFGINKGLEEEPLTNRLIGKVSASLTVKAIASVGWSSLMV